MCAKISRSLRGIHLTVSLTHEERLCIFTDARFEHDRWHHARRYVRFMNTVFPGGVVLLVITRYRHIWLWFGRRQRTEPFDRMTFLHLQGVLYSPIFCRDVIKNGYVTGKPQRAHHLFNFLSLFSCPSYQSVSSVS